MRSDGWWGVISRDGLRKKAIRYGESLGPPQKKHSRQTIHQEYVYVRTVPLILTAFKNPALHPIKAPPGKVNLGIA